MPGYKSDNAAVSTPCVTGANDNQGTDLVYESHCRRQAGAIWQYVSIDNFLEPLSDDHPSTRSANRASTDADNRIVVFRGFVTALAANGATISRNFFETTVRRYAIGTQGLETPSEAYIHVPTTDYLYTVDTGYNHHLEAQYANSPAVSFRCLGSLPYMVYSTVIGSFAACVADY